jgi:hypothetical protein
LSAYNKSNCHLNLNYINDINIEPKFKYNGIFSDDGSNEIDSISGLDQFLDNDMMNKLDQILFPNDILSFVV